MPNHWKTTVCGDQMNPATVCWLCSVVELVFIYFGWNGGPYSHQSSLPRASTVHFCTSRAYRRLSAQACHKTRANGRGQFCPKVRAHHGIRPGVWASTSVAKGMIVEFIGMKWSPAHTPASKVVLCQAPRINIMSWMILAILWPQRSVLPSL